MIDATIYETSTGTIRRVVRLMNEQEAVLNCRADESWVEGTCDPRLNRVESGLIVSLGSDHADTVGIGEAWIAARQKRDDLLTATDWTQAEDAPVDKYRWAKYREDLRTMFDGVTDPRTVVFPALPEPTLEDAKRLARDKILSLTATIRKQFITEAPGQEMIYLAKQEEAKAWLSDPTPALANYPLISAEIGVTGQDGYQISQIWLYMAATWIQVAAVIEGARIQHMNMVDAALTSSQAEGAALAFEAWGKQTALLLT